MQESQSHGALKVSKAVVVSIDEVEGQGPLDWTTALAWSSAYQAGPITINTHHMTTFSTWFSIDVLVLCSHPWIHHMSIKFYSIKYSRTCEVGAVMCWRLSCGPELSDRHWGQPTEPAPLEDPLSSPWLQIAGRRSQPGLRGKVAPEGWQMGMLKRPTFYMKHLNMITQTTFNLKSEN